MLASSAGTAWEMTTGNGDRWVGRKCLRQSWTLLGFESPQPIPWGQGRRGRALSHLGLVRQRGPECSFPRPLGRDEASKAELPSAACQRNVASDFTSHSWQHTVAIFLWCRQSKERIKC